SLAHLARDWSVGESPGQGRVDEDLCHKEQENGHMARLAGVDIPREKRVVIALTYIYGVGKSGSVQVLDETGIDANTRVKDLSDDEIVTRRDSIKRNLRVEGPLRREVAAAMRPRAETGSYQGPRHRRGLPVRGQRTKTNARTRKGPKKRAAGRQK